MPSVLYTASTFSHILNFHLPYLRRFRELGWQVEVACGGPVRDIPFADGAVSLPLEKKMSSPANFQAASQLRAMVIRQQYDLIITHTSLAAFFTRWALRGMKHRPKLINVVHGYLFDDETSGLKRGLLTRAETMTAPQTDLLLTMNAWDTRWGHGPPCRAPCGGDPRHGCRPHPLPHRTGRTAHHAGQAGPVGGRCGPAVRGGILRPQEPAYPAGGPARACRKT